VPRPTPPGAGAENQRARRLRAPLFVSLGTLLAIEALGGLVIFFARLAWGITPGETLHVIAGVALTLVYAVYQWQHWSRVAPFRARLDYALGLIAAIFMAATNLTGLWLGALWWQVRVVEASSDAVRYPSPLAAAHNIGSMVVLTFVGAHLGAVLTRDARAKRERRTGDL
jgi:hypothetical protein